ncbi:hypothetical protein FQA39_LY16317 [Lamprigera yunnana]|nr:hypothetical protein FQA39_LY16317 [Lamprigera yunnana]
MIKFAYFLPIVIFVWFSTTFIITYVIAVLRKDVNPVFPYISDSGAFSPESCIFGQMLNTGAILMVLFMYVRHRQIRFLCEKHSIHNSVRSKSIISVWFGAVAAFGVSVVANFQETNVFIVHILGAIFSFGFGSVWQCFQTWISFKIVAYLGTVTLNRVRLILCGISVSAFLISSFCGLIGLLYFKGEDPTKWNKNDGGFNFHIVSTITEWINAFGIVGFILSFTPDLKNISFEEPQIQIYEEIISESSASSESVPVCY